MGFYVLFEKSSSDSGENLTDYDAMGIARTEVDAMFWQSENIPYRTYKYCPESEFEIDE